MQKKLYEKIALFGVICLFLSLLINPTVGRNGTFLGLKICGTVIIPSLFPFTFLSIFLIKSGLFKNVSIFQGITRFLFGLNGDEFILFIMSCVGGYPLGAKILNEQVKEGKMSQNRASCLILAFVNPGPAFCVLVVGLGIFSSREIGLLLYFVCLISSFLILQILRFFSVCEKSSIPLKKRRQSIGDSFVSSAYETSTAIISICVFVIFFSFLVSYVDFFAGRFLLLGNVSYLLEVTSAVTRTKNLYLISFLLGFSCLSIILQIFSVANQIKIKKYLFLFSRILNGFLNLIFTKIFVKVFGVSVATSQNIVLDYGSVFTNPMLCFALVMMVIVFLISISTKNSAWKIKDDVV